MGDIIMMFIRVNYVTSFNSIINNCFAIRESKRCWGTATQRAFKRFNSSPQITSAATAASSDHHSRNILKVRIASCCIMTLSLRKEPISGSFTELYIYFVGLLLKEKKSKESLLRAQSALICQRWTNARHSLFRHSLFSACQTSIEAGIMQACHVIMGVK